MTDLEPDPLHGDSTVDTMNLERLDPELAMLLSDFPEEMADINRGNVNAIREMMNV